MKSRIGVVVVALLAAVAAAAGGQTAAQFRAATTNEPNEFSAATSFPSSCPAPTAYYLGGFETGVLPGPSWGGAEGTPSVDSTVARHGTYSGKVTKDTSGIEGFWQVAQPPVVLSFAIRLPTLPSADVVKLFTAEESSGTQFVAVGYEAATQKLRLHSSVPESVVASTTVTPGTWYVIDLKIDTVDTPATASWRIDGVAQGSVGIAVPLLLYIGWGSDVLTDVFDMQVDDIFMTRNPADYPFGGVEVRALAPNAVGTHSGEANFNHDDSSVIDAGTPSRLDEVPMSGTTDFVRQINPSATSYVEVGFADTTSTCILGVEAHATVRKPSGAPNHAKVSAFVGTTETVLHDGDHDPLAVTWSAPVNPGAASWTAAAVNGIVARFGYSTDATPNPYLDALHLEYAVK